MSLKYCESHEMALFEDAIGGKIGFTRAKLKFFEMWVLCGLQITGRNLVELDGVDGAISSGLLVWMVVDLVVAIW